MMVVVPLNRRQYVPRTAVQCASILFGAVAIPSSIFNTGLQGSNMLRAVFYSMCHKALDDFVPFGSYAAFVLLAMRNARIDVQSDPLKFEALVKSLC